MPTRSWSSITAASTSGARTARCSRPAGSMAGCTNCRSRAAAWSGRRDRLACGVPSGPGTFVPDEFHGSAAEMIALETDGRRFPVATGETTIGSGTGVGIPLEGTGVAPRHAVVRAWPDGTVSVAGVAGSVVRVNGIAVSAEPMPLLHGDRIEIGERQLLAVDQAAVGGTQLMSAITTAPGAEPSVPPAGPAYE